MMGVSSSCVPRLGREPTAAVQESAADIYRCHRWGEKALVAGVDLHYSECRQRDIMAPDEGRLTITPRRGPEKPNEVIDLAFVSDSAPLGPLQHEIFNTILAWCQLEIRTRPPDIDSASDQIDNQFTFPLSTFMGLCGYASHTPRGEGSKNVSFFVDTAMGLRGRAVLFSGFERLRADGDVERPPKGRRRSAFVVNEKEGFFHLVSSLVIDRANDTIQVELPKMLCLRLLQTEETTQLEALLSKFTTRAAYVLWELSLKHMRDGALPRKKWLVWSRILSGDHEPHKTFREFNKMLRRAVEQVSATLRGRNRSLVPRFSKKGRAIDELWFELVELEQRVLELPESDAGQVVQKLVQYGVFKSEAAMLYSKYGEGRVLRNLEYALQQHKKSPKRKLGAYIRECVLKNFAPQRQPSLPEITPPVSQPSVVQIKVGESSVRSWLANLGAAEQGRVLQLFKVEADPVKRRIVEGEPDLSKAGPLGVVTKWVERRLEEGRGLPI